MPSHYYAYQFKADLHEIRPLLSPLRVAYLDIGKYLCDDF